MSRMPKRKVPLSDSGPPLSPLPPQRIEPEGAWRWLLPGILVIYLVLACAHAALVPTGQTGFQNAPDEAAHMEYIRTLIEGHLPTRTSAAGSPVGYEWHQPPLYYLVARLFCAFGDKGPRYFSILCGLGCIFLIYRTGRLLFPDDPRFAALAAAICAWTPTHIAITSTINNDGLLELCFSGTILTIVSIFHAGLNPTRALWLGIAVGCAILTKATGVLLLPVSMVALALAWKSGEEGSTVVRSGITALFTALAICGWWFGRNLILYGQLIPLNAFQQAFGGTAQAADMARALGSWNAYYQLVATWTFQSLWAVYGSKQDLAIGRPRFLPPQAYQILALLSIGAAIGLGVAHVKRKVLTRSQNFGIYILFLTLGLVGLSFALFIQRYFQAQGRYFYPAWLPICLLFALGWKALVPARYYALTCAVIPGLLGLLAIAYLMTIAGHL